MVKRSDPSVRMRDYVRSISEWLQLPPRHIDGIVLVENSGADLSELREIFAERNVHEYPVEIVQYNGNHIPDGLHYGYAEVAMIDRALQESELLKRSPYFAKSTGRLFFPAFNDLLDRVPGHYDAVIDARWNIRKVHSPIPFATTQLMLFRRDFYLSTLANRLDWFQPFVYPRQHVEHFVYEVLTQAKNPDVHFRFPINADPMGTGAHQNRAYQSTSRRLESTIRGVSRRVAPWAWL